MDTQPTIKLRLAAILSSKYLLDRQPPLKGSLMKNPARLKLARKTIRPAIVLTTPQLKALTKTRTTKSERLAYQLEQIEHLWLDMDEFPIQLDSTQEVATALRAAQGDPTDKAKLKALADALHGLEDEMYDNLRVTPQDCCNLAVGLEKLCK